MQKVDADVWTDVERSAWALPEDLTVSEWADKCRVLDPRSSAEPGQWRTDRAPYLRGIMDAFSDDTVERITFMKSTQVGGTEAEYNCIGYVIDQDPGPTLIVYPREDDARSNSYNRIQPMLKLAPALARHIPNLGDDLSKMEYHLDLMSVYLAGANSPAGLASRPIRYLFFDEVDKFPPYAGKEADPIKLGIERTRTFWNRKIFEVSSPTSKSGYVYRSYDMSDKRTFRVACPHCGQYQRLLFSRVKWSDGATADELREGGQAWYECQHCGKKISDRDKAEMLKHGVWCPDGCDVVNGVIVGDIPKTPHRGFWINCLYSPWLRFADIAAEFLDSKGNFATLQNFTNSWLAETFEVQTNAVNANSLNSVDARKGLPRGEVPNEAQFLTAFIDWHGEKNGYYFSVVAWAAGRRGWLVHFGRVFSEADLDREIFQTEFKSADGRTWTVPFAGVDSGDGNRVHEVYAFAQARFPRMRPTKGERYMAGAPFQDTRIDYTHRITARVFKGFSGLRINTTYFKDTLAAMLNAPDDREHDTFSFCEGVSHEWIQSLRSEHKIREKSGKEYWAAKSEGANNHPWDTLVGCLALAERFGLLRLTREKPVTNADRARAEPRQAAAPVGPVQSVDPRLSGQRGYSSRYSSFRRH